MFERFQQFCRFKVGATTHTGASAVQKIIDHLAGSDFSSAADQKLTTELRQFMMLVPADKLADARKVLEDAKAKGKQGLEKLSKVKGGKKPVKAGKAAAASSSSGQVDEATQDALDIFKVG